MVRKYGCFSKYSSYGVLSWNKKFQKCFYKDSTAYVLYIPIVHSISKNLNVSRKILMMNCFDKQRHVF